MPVALYQDSSIQRAGNALCEVVAGRSRRILILIIGIMLLSIADLAITLTHLKSVGMIEANPLAAWLIRQTNSAWALAGYKFVTVGFCVSVLWYVRRLRMGELAAWASLIICAGMSLAWHRYTTGIDDLDAMSLAQAGGCDQWLIID